MPEHPAWHVVMGQQHCLHRFSRHHERGTLHFHHHMLSSFTGVPVSSDVILHTSFLSIATWLNAKDASTADGTSAGPSDMDIDPPAAQKDLSEAMSSGPGAASSSPGAGPSSPDQDAAQEQIIKKVMQEFIFHSRAEVIFFAWNCRYQYQLLVHASVDCMHSTGCTLMYHFISCQMI